MSRLGVLGRVVILWLLCLSCAAEVSTDRDGEAADGEGGAADVMAESGEEVVPPPLSAVELPKDSAPHEDLVEWWYWTGHVQASEAGAAGPKMPNLVQNYWEGAVTVTGTRGEAPVTGVGYVELTGYATDPGDPK
jgi:predicted secreted hydrolase